MKRTRMWKERILLAFGLGVLAIAAFAACGDDDDDPDEGGDTTPVATAQATAGGGDGDEEGDEAAVEAAVEAAYAAYNAKDVDALLALFTEKGAQAVLGEEGVPLEDIRASLPEFIGEPPISTQGFEKAEIDGDTASIETKEVFGAFRSDTKYTLVREGELWKIDGEEDAETEIPDDATAINVDMNEFAFGVNADDIVSVDGLIAFEGNNVGDQPHEIALAKIPADADIETLLMTEEDVPGFEFIGGVGPFEPGESGNMVFTEELTAGRYLMVCFLPDTSAGPDGPPHAVQGMYKEFTIE